jgi:hypothetical protein
MSNVYTGQYQKRNPSNKMYFINTKSASRQKIYSAPLENRFTQLLKLTIEIILMYSIRFNGKMLI